MREMAVGCLHVRRKTFPSFHTTAVKKKYTYRRRLRTYFAMTGPLWPKEVTSLHSSRVAAERCNRQNVKFVSISVAANEWISLQLD